MNTIRTFIENMTFVKYLIYTGLSFCIFMICHHILSYRSKYHKELLDNSPSWTWWKVIVCNLLWFITIPFLVFYTVGICILFKKDELDEYLDKDKEND